MARTLVSWFNVDASVLEDFAKIACIELLCFTVLFKFMRASLTYDITSRFLTNSFSPLRAITLLFVIRPIAKEVIFRGFLQERAEDALSFVPSRIDVNKPYISNFIQSAIYGLYNRSVSSAVMAMQLGELKNRGDSLVSPIVIHSMAQIASLIVNMVVSKKIRSL